MWSREKSMLTVSEHAAESGKSNEAVKGWDPQRSPVKLTRAAVNTVIKQGQLGVKAGLLFSF